jgi:excisionase family DNA binding protein
MEELWDIARVASSLGVTERTVYNKVRGGELPAVKVGRLWRVRESDLEAWLGRSERRGPAAALGAPAFTVAEPGPIPSREELDALLAPLVDQLERRLMFVGLLSGGVEALGWPAPVVVGGHAVEFYTAGSYATVDIDLAGDSEPVGQVLDTWGFEREGRHFYDEGLRLVVEVPGVRPDPESLSHVVRVRAGRSIVNIIGIEDLIIDRLNACKYWRDKDSCDWARTMVLAAEDLDLAYLRRLADQEDVAELLEPLLTDAGR